jgi:GNAT superfamily N-acetyltransferase
MQRVHRIAEAEVIAELLKHDFHQPEYHADRESFEDVVFRPDLRNQQENAARRALLFRRRAGLWRELPGDTQWWEVRLETADLDLIRVAARPEWKRIANGSMLLKDVAERIRSGRFRGDSVRKVQAIGYRLREGPDCSSVMLIGVDEHQPLTILEGNHRLAAALLMHAQQRHAPGTPLASSRPGLESFRVIAGFSPRMNECGC